MVVHQVMDLRSFRFITFAWFFFVSIELANAGLNKFTKLDEFDQWIIERKFDLYSQKLYCRASMSGYGTWFAARIRLDKNHQLVIPPDLDKTYKPSEALLVKIKEALKDCSLRLIYTSRD